MKKNLSKQNIKLFDFYKNIEDREEVITTGIFKEERHCYDKNSK